jgi:hypothetical protein
MVATIPAIAPMLSDGVDWLFLFEFGCNFELSVVRMGVGGWYEMGAVVVGAKLFAADALPAVLLSGFALVFILVGTIPLVPTGVGVGLGVTVTKTVTALGSPVDLPATTFKLPVVAATISTLSRCI